MASNNDDRIPIRYAIYHDNGRLRQSGMCHRNAIEPMSANGGTFVELSHEVKPELTWYDAIAGAIADRTELPATLDKLIVAIDEVATVTGIPDGADLIIDGAEVAFAGGPAEISFGRAGMYRINIRHVKHLDWEKSIEVQS